MTPEQRTAWAKQRACDLAVVVRDEPREGIEKWLARYTRHDLEAIAVTLACMVPDDRPVSELLAWIEEPAAPRTRLHTAAPPKRSRPTKAEMVGRATTPRAYAEVDVPVPHAYPLTAEQRRRLTAQDKRLRRCWACQEWAYGEDDCKACGTSVHEPARVAS